MASDDDHHPDHSSPEAHESDDEDALDYFGPPEAVLRLQTVEDDDVDREIEQVKALGMDFSDASNGNTVIEKPVSEVAHSGAVISLSVREIECIAIESHLSLQVQTAAPSMPNTSVVAPLQIAAPTAASDNPTGRVRPNLRAAKRKELDRGCCDKLVTESHKNNPSSAIECAREGCETG